MAAHEQDRHPRTVRTSRTGRVPQWVLDEAAGRKVTPVPFRGATYSAVAPPRERPSRRILRGIGISAVAAVVAATYFVNVPIGTPGLQSTAAASTAQAPPQRHEEARHPLGAVPTAPDRPEGQGYRFMAHQKGQGKPVTWSPCRPIHFLTREAGQPAGGGLLVQQAFGIVAAATGLQFVDDGGTAEGPSADRSAYQPRKYGKRWAPVLIAWATPDEVPDFGVDVAGEAGAVPATTRSGDQAYVSGIVYLDGAKLQRISTTQGAAAARVIILHELGHLVGLQHVNDPSQVMFPRSSGSVVAFGQGDLAGLAALGRGACQRDI